ncbi:PK beta-barrel-protein domain-containing protein-like protein [Teratosphaeria nubilosa]|uniref:PK beta-barrel-protein domain-containing protein-like protein n=1 Tax=Teratosphaeria nubilosa TaxID=161662 RepID=A0A6G1KZ98_9PEZI|nr:PK beta-barrel-protein domain-containing protein-like protein [Teratosphaeria nubilosa]
MTTRAQFPSMKAVVVPGPVGILEVRSGKVKTIAPGVRSAIFKEKQQGPVHVNETGIITDQQAFKGHGGAHLFTYGGFGENIVPDGTMTEENVCIGDRWRIGGDDDGVVIEVSQPRLPCFKLNVRFDFRTSAKKAQATSRVGWHNRVLKLGSIQAGDQMLLLERPNPQWSVANVHRVIHVRKPDLGLFKKVSQIKTLGNETRELVEQRLQGQNVDAKGRLGVKVKWLPNEVFEVHYAVRSMTDAAYANLLPGTKTMFYAKDEQHRLEIESVVPVPADDGKSGAKVYCCSPASLMKAASECTASLNYPADLIHFEDFGGSSSSKLGDSFEVEVHDPYNDAKHILSVPEDKSLLDVLNDAGLDVPSSCQAGKCGMCTVEVCKVDMGRTIHRGTALGPKPEETGSMLSCVSRGVGKLCIALE